MLVQTYQAPQSREYLGGQGSQFSVLNTFGGEAPACFSHNVPIRLSGISNNEADTSAVEGNVNNSSFVDSEINVAEKSQSGDYLEVKTDLSQCVSEKIVWEITVNETFIPNEKHSSNNGDPGRENIINADVANVSQYSSQKNNNENEETAKSEPHSNSDKQIKEPDLQVKQSAHMIQKTCRVDHDREDGEHEEAAITMCRKSPRLGQNHKVTFKNQNEFVQQSEDGAFIVSYREATEEDIPVSKEKKSKVPAVKVQFDEKSSLQQPLKVYTDTIGVSSRMIEQEAAKLQDFEEEDELDNPFQPEGEVSHDADIMLHLWKGGVEVTKESFQSMEIMDENIVKEREYDERYGENSIALNMETSHDASIKFEENMKVESNELNLSEDEMMKETKADQSVSSGKCLTLDSQGSDEESVACYPITLVEKKKHKDIFKKHCKVM